MNHIRSEHVLKINALRQHPAFKVLKWLLLVFFLIIFLNLLDLPELLSSFRKMSFFAFISSAASLLLARFLYAVRLQRLLAGLHYPAPIQYILRINLLAEFVSIAMPSYAAGDVVRVDKLHKYVVRTSITISVALIDRVIGLATMVFLALIFLPSTSISTMWRLPLSSIELAALLSAIALLAILISLNVTKKSQNKYMKAYSRVNRSSIALAIMVSLLGHTAFAFAYFVLFGEFEVLTLREVIGMVMLSQTVLVIPVSVFGIGPNEGLLFLFAQLAGLSHEAIVAILVVAVGIRYLFAFTGFVWEFGADGREFFIKNRAKKVEDHDQQNPI